MGNTLKRQKTIPCGHYGTDLLVRKTSILHGVVAL